jgi:hypothetical protein
MRVPTCRGGHGMCQPTLYLVMRTYHLLVAQIPSPPHTRATIRFLLQKKKSYNKITRIPIPWPPRLHDAILLCRRRASFPARSKYEAAGERRQAVRGRYHRRHGPPQPLPAFRGGDRCMPAQGPHHRPPSLLCIRPVQPSHRGGLCPRRPTSRHQRPAGI